MSFKWLATTGFSPVALPQLIVADKAEQTLQLAAALDQLPTKYREVLTLRHIDGLSHEQIAKLLGRSTAATRMLWIRALEKLKTVYGQSPTS